MRGWILLVATAAYAQDDRGFVNERLVTQNFVKNSLQKAKTKTIMPALKPTSACAIPLVQVQPSRSVDPMVVQVPKNTGDDQMILPTIPVCPAK